MLVIFFKEHIPAKQAMTSQPHCAITPLNEASLLLQLSGDWTLQLGIPDTDEIKKQLQETPAINRLDFVTKDIGLWDSSLLTWLMIVQDYCQLNNINLDKKGLPEGVGRLLELAYAVPERQDAKGHEQQPGILHNVGSEFIDAVFIVGEFVEFLGESLLAMLKLIRGKAVYRRSDFWFILQNAGVLALPIVSLVSFLVGMILGFVGAVQLENFGAGIYIADLVGIAMTREMGAIMTGIIMAGRTGAAYAAEIGSMTVNEEVDALTTAGFSAMEFLVVPRMLALILMMPLLVVYADLMGILGGAVVAVSILDLTFLEYSNQLLNAVSLADFFAGIFMAIIFGIIVALVGCMQGIRCGRSSQAVGVATTSAVVSSIVMIVVACAVMTVIFNAMGI
jgi:phospholipid/cholesterol/gamma-HCH transport system permease protein